MGEFGVFVTVHDYRIDIVLRFIRKFIHFAMKSAAAIGPCMDVCLYNMRLE